MIPRLQTFVLLIFAALDSLALRRRVRPPRQPRSSDLVVRVEVDSADAVAEIERVAATLDRARVALEKTAGLS